MDPSDFPNTTASCKTVIMGKALLAASIMRPWPPSVDEACEILAAQPYEVLERIGHGGMGAVFKVRNLEPGMDRIEAVKIRRPEVRDDDRFRERFLREIGTLAQLRHPGITTIYRSGDSAEGYLWFSMEFLEGQSLAELLAPGMTPLSPERVLDITRQLCITLQFIHKESRLHRDLKPANVMVCDDGSVRLLDFGIARPAVTSATGMLTRPGEMPHTPNYAAPEQKNGGAVDERTDLYGLGRIITEMIHPANSTGLNRPAIYPQRLLDLVDDLLAFDQQQRPSSATDVFEKLGQIEPGSPGFWGKDRCPFRGLEAYQPEHAEIFFGRDAAIRRGREIIWANSNIPWNGFLLIMGASGSGKSSLARAGLGPALLREGCINSPESKITSPIICDLGTIRPENDCLLPPLARCLTGAFSGIDPKVLAEALSQPGSDLASLLETTPDKANDVRFCLILDQFEHFFRTALPRNAQTRFLNAISRLSRIPGLVVLVTMRSDFYHCCASHPVLMDLKEGRQLDLAPPQPWELAAMLRLSARASGLRFETLPDGSSLDDILLDHARRNPQTLPLLSYMLDQLWEHRDCENGLLRFSDYQALGGFEGSVSSKATETFARFSEDYPDNPDAALDKLFRLVVETSESATAPTFVRRFAAREELDSIDPAVRRLAERFVASRLFVTNDDGDTSNHGLTLAHECLLRVWPQAIAWAEQNRDFLLTRSRIAARMREGSPLLEGDPLLESAKTHTLRQPESFAPEQLEYVRDATLAVKARSRRTTRRRRLAFTLLGALTTLAMIGGAIAWRMKDVADEQRATAETRRIQVTRERDQQEALLWSASRGDHEAALRASAGHQYADSLALFDRALEYRPENQLALTASAAHFAGSNALAWRMRSVLTREGWEPQADLDFKGNYLAEGIDGLTLRVSDAASGKEICKLEFDRIVRSVVFSPCGRLLAAACEDGTVRVIEIAASTEIDKLKISKRGLGDFLPVEIDRIVRSVVFSPCRRLLAAKCDDGTVRVVEIATGKEIDKLKISKKLFSPVCFSPDARWLAAGGDDKSVLLLEVATGKGFRKLGLREDVDSLDFSPDGSFFAASCESRVMIIEVETCSKASEILVDERVQSVSFSPDCRWLAVASGLNTVLVFAAATGEQINKIRLGSIVNSVGFSPDGRYLVAATRGRGAWRLIETGNIISEGSVKSFGFSVDLLGWGRRFISPKGDYLAVDKYVDWLQLIDTKTGKEVGERAPSTGKNYTDSVGYTDNESENIIPKSKSVAFGSSGQHVAVGNLSKTARVFEVATGKLISKIEFDESVIAVCVSHDGELIAAGFFDKTVRVMKVATREEITRMPFTSDVTSLGFSLDSRQLVVGTDDKTVRQFEVATGKETNRLALERSVLLVNYSPDSQLLAVNDSDNTVRVIDSQTGKEFSNLKFSSPVTTVGFDPDGRYLAVGCNDCSRRVIDCRWFNSTESSSMAWRAALRMQAGVQFAADGRLVPLLADELLAAQREVTDFINSDPKPNERWQHAILKWSQMQPEERTTSPWSDEPIRIAVGRSLMRMRSPRSSIAECADQAPWHPLEPLSLARLEPRPVVSGAAPASAEPKPDEPRPSAPAGVKSIAPSAPTGVKIKSPVESAVKAPPPIQPTDPATREAMMIRPRFLAKLTLKRLREADEKLYGRDTLAEYAVWSAKIMHEELHLDPESLEAINFALERTPENKQQPLLDLKVKLVAAE